MNTANRKNRSKKAAFRWSRVSRGSADECWPWSGSLNAWGYGDVQLDGVVMNASRAAYISVHGAPLEGLVVCHRCDNPACCNPAHLFAATQAENLADCRAKGRAVYRTGSEHHRPCAKLTAEKVAEAKRLYSDGVSQSEIGRRWGIHPSTISRAVRGEYWAHLS